MHDLDNLVLQSQTLPQTCLLLETITHNSSLHQITTVRTISEDMNRASLAHATKRGVQLIRKTSSRVVHTITEALFPIGEVTFSFDNETQVKH